MPYLFNHCMLPTRYSNTTGSNSTYTSVPSHLKSSTPCHSNSSLPGQHSAMPGQQSSMHGQSKPTRCSQQSSMPGESTQSLPRLQSSVTNWSKSLMSGLQPSLSDQSDTDQSKSSVHNQSISGQQSSVPRLSNSSVPGQLGASVYSQSKSDKLESSVSPQRGTSLSGRKSLKLSKKSSNSSQNIEGQLFERILHCAKNDSTHNQNVTPKKLSTATHKDTNVGRFPTLEGKVQDSGA